MLENSELSILIVTILQNNIEHSFPVFDKNELFEIDNFAYYTLIAPSITKKIKIKESWEGGGGGRFFLFIYFTVIILKGAAY